LSLSQNAVLRLLHPPWGNHPRLQILTAADRLAGRRIDAPPSQQVDVTFKR